LCADLKILENIWLGDTMVRASDSWSCGQRFDSVSGVSE